jgi:tetratricopeptide (TPR) repeat protein
LNRSIGNRSIQSLALVFTAAVQTIQGQFGQALANIKAAMALSEEAGDPLSKQGTYAWLQSLLLYAGALDQAERWADKLYALRESMMPISQTTLLTSIARVKIACGKLDQASAILDQMLEEFNWNSSWSHTITFIAIADGYLQLALGKPERVFTRWHDQAREVIETIAAHAGELRDTFLAQPAVAAVLAERQA